MGLVVDVPKIVAIDPGCLHTGVVYMDEYRVVDAATFSYPKSVGADNALLYERCICVWNRLDAFMAAHPHDAVVIEGYIPFTSNKFTMSHQTPWLVGYLLSELHGNGEKIAIQTSRDVLNPRIRGNVKAIVDDLAAGRDVYPESKKLTNEHLRSAFAHGYYFLKGRGYIS